MRLVPMMVEMIPAIPYPIFFTLWTTLFQGTGGYYTKLDCGEKYAASFYRNCGFVVGDRLPGLKNCSCNFKLLGSGDDDVLAGVECINQMYQHSHGLVNLPYTIQEVTFVGNNLSELQPYMFGYDMRSGACNMVYLNLSSNNIKTIYDMTLNGVGSVETLVLDNNQWELSDATGFTFHSSLRKLYLNKAIKPLPSMRHILFLAGILAESNLKWLEEIHLQSNEIGFLNTNIFCPPRSLKVVQLANNGIFISYGLLNAACMRNVEELYLHNNSLSYLTKYDTEQLDEMVNNGKLRVLTLHNNTWRCDCYSLDFLAWIQSNTSRADILGNARYDLRCEPRRYFVFGGTPLVNVRIERINKTCPHAEPMKASKPLQKSAEKQYIVFNAVLTSIAVSIFAAMYFIIKRYRKVDKMYQLRL